MNAQRAVDLWIAEKENKIFATYVVLRFEIFYGMSNIDLGWIDMEHSRQKVG